MFDFLALLYRNAVGTSGCNDISVSTVDMSFNMPCDFLLSLLRLTQMICLPACCLLPGTNLECSDAVLILCIVFVTVTLRLSANFDNNPDVLARQDRIHWDLP